MTPESKGFLSARQGMTRAHCAGCRPYLGEQRQQWASATRAPKSIQTFDEVADHWLKLCTASWISFGRN